jgi:hypothetical protein
MRNLMPTGEESPSRLFPSAVNDSDVSVLGCARDLPALDQTAICLFIETRIQGRENRLTQTNILSNDSCQVLVTPNHFKDELQFATNEIFQVFDRYNLRGFLKPT